MAYISDAHIGDTASWNCLNSRA